MRIDLKYSRIFVGGIDWAIAYGSLSSDFLYFGLKGERFSGRWNHGGGKSRDAHCIFFPGAMGVQCWDAGYLVQVWFFSSCRLKPSDQFRFGQPTEFSRVLSLLTVDLSLWHCDWLTTWVTSNSQQAMSKWINWLMGRSVVCVMTSPEWHLNRVEVSWNISGVARSLRSLWFVAKLDHMTSPTHELMTGGRRARYIGAGYMMIKWE